MTTIPKESLVSIHNGQPFTETLDIAIGVNLQHKNVLALVRKFQPDFEELGPLAFETRKGEKLKQGGFAKPTELAILNEDQATYLITLFRNTPIVRAFKLRLVKAFREALKEIERLNKQRSEPAWKLVRDETKLGYKWMSSALKDSREEQGKETASHHYSNEARLINSIMTNQFTGLDRENLDKAALTMIGNLQLENTKLISKGFDYQKRKEILRDKLIKKIACDSDDPLPKTGRLENGKVVVPVSFSIEDLRHISKQHGL